MEDVRFEPPERPPSLDLLDQLTGGRFSRRWFKYMYNRFKNECPTGRMHFPEFKRLFGVFIPDRLNDGYLERMFHAFCLNATHPDQLTFRDLMVGLSRLCDENPAASAEWLMRLIGRERGGQITYQEFVEFVKSVFTLRGKSELNEQKRRDGSLLLGGSGSPPPSATLPPLDAGGTGITIKGGGTSPNEKRQQSLQRHHHHHSQLQRHHILPHHHHQFPRPPTVRSVALLASAITTPTAAPAIASFMPFVGHANKRGSNSPDQQTIRAIRRRASLVFKELDTDHKGYLISNDFERFFRNSRDKQKSLFIYAS